MENLGLETGKMIKSDALYRKEHWFAIKLKAQMYKRLPHAKKLRRKSNRKRRNYFKKYYNENKERLIKKAVLWGKQNRDKRKVYCKKHKERLKLGDLDYRPKIKRVREKFIEYCGQRHKEHTTKQYKMNVDRFFTYIDSPGIRCKEYFRKLYYENRKPSEEKDFSWRREFYKIRFTTDIDRNLITKYVSYVNHDEVNNKGMKLNSSEKATRLYPLRAFLLFCQRKGFIKKDLRRFVIVPPREKKVLKRLMTVDEMDRFLKAPGEKETVRIRDRALLELAYSGFRANEILTLKLKHIDIETNAVTILDTKGDKDRVVPMTTECIYWIKRWLQSREEFVGNHEAPEYLFITSGRRPIIRRNFSNLIKKYAKKAKIPLDVSPHDLRRVTATHLVENGAPIRQIQALLGHASLKVTTKYLRLSDERIKKEHKETHPSNRRKLYYGKIQR